MATFKVSVPEDKTSFFIEVLELIGATYETREHVFQLSDEQKSFLLRQNDVPIEDCTPALDLYESLKTKYGL